MEVKTRGYRVQLLTEVSRTTAIRHGRTTGGEVPTCRWGGAYLQVGRCLPAGGEVPT